MHSKKINQQSAVGVRYAGYIRDYSHQCRKCREKGYVFLLKRLASMVLIAALHYTKIPAAVPLQPAVQTQMYAVGLSHKIANGLNEWNQYLIDYFQAQPPGTNN